MLAYYEYTQEKETSNFKLAVDVIVALSEDVKGHVKNPSVGR
jgi:hypothetical protein